MSIGELKEENISRLADMLEPLVSLRETVGEWQLGTFGLSRRDATFRKGYSGHLSDTSRFRTQEFGPTPGGRTGIALIFRQFDSSPHQDYPAEYFVGWVPVERSEQLQQWYTFLTSELRKRQEGVHSEQTRVTYSYSTPQSSAPSDGFVVELYLDDTVRLVHTKQQTSRAWEGRALPALWKALNVALGSSGFPARPSVRVAPAGKDSFTLTVTRSGSVVSVSGFPSPEYKYINDFFRDVVVQMANGQVLDVEATTETPYVSDACEKLVSL